MSLPAHTVIRDAIAAKVSGAQAGAMVHTFERYATHLGDLKALFVDTTVDQPKLMGCHIRRTATKRTAPSTGRWHTRHTWALRFFMALDDAAQSELAFDTWLEAVAEAFRTDQTLGGLAASLQDDSYDNTDGLQLEESVPVMFCGVLSHSARCTLQTLHFH